MVLVRSGAGSESVLRLRRDAVYGFLMVSPAFAFREHWLHSRNALCAEENCPACELWEPKRQTIAIVRRFLSHAPAAGLGALILPESAGLATVAPGTLFGVKYSRRSARIAIEGPSECQAIDAWRAAAVVARLFRLPMPPSVDGEPLAAWWAGCLDRAHRRLDTETIR